MHRTSDPGFPSASGSATRRRRGRWVVAAALTLAPLVGVASACLDRPIGSPPPVTTNIFVDKITQTSVDKIDLLFMIDNSISMSDKQDILQLAVPDLVNRLVNPICVDSMGNQGEAPPPGGECPTGFSQEFNPINDINIGIVSSSLGDVGANVACPAENANQQYVPDRIDLAHLVGSLDRGRNTANTPQGFLQWRAGGDLDDLNERFQRMVRAVGESGCGWEASLESWYRFLVDPFPYRQLVRVRCPGSESDGLNCVQQATDADGTILLDQTVLDQRAAFLRPDSLVAVIMLSDENDCSMQVGAQTWVVAAINDPRPMFRGSSQCAVDANDKCCYSCPLGPPAGCAADPICNESANNQENRLPASEDGQNLRCFQQKRRFGVDFLYPTQRYVNALSQTNICWNALDLSTEGCNPADIRPNPLYAGGRLQDLVFFGGIVGVPWQAIASTVDANGRELEPGALRFQDAEELEQNGTWDEILGSPGRAWRAASNGRPEVEGVPAVPPENILMVESEFERPGVVVNNINGREYNTIEGGGTEGARDDLQYACIFPLPAPRDCNTRDPNLNQACDCYGSNTDRPLCEQNPGVSPRGNIQYWSKAYPGTRHLEVLKGYGANSIVASICARDVQDGDDEDESDFGYRPAIASIVDRLKEQLGDRCLPRPLLVNEVDDTVACSLVETLPRAPEGGCNCNPNFARQAPDPVVDSVVRGQLAAERGQPCGADDENCTQACLCEVLQVQQVTSNQANALELCRNDPEASGVQGWCYVDADQNIGSAALVENCPATARRILRFVGRGLEPNSITYVACQGSSFAADQ